MEQLKHECGVAMIRLLKPLEYYQEKYGTWMYGLNKLYLLMEKQHNRGQEGAGLACVKMEASPGEEYLFRERALGTGAITEIFSAVQSRFKDISAERLSDAAFARRHLPFAGEMYMGHLRYSTTGKSGLSFVHPFLRRNNWRAKNLALCGNFNLTNVDEVFASITAQGQHPRIYSDTYIMLEQVGHRLDRECERLYAEAVSRGLEGTAVTEYIEERVDVNNVLRTAAPLWDGGYVVCGLTGSGEMFAMRDPWGIRPAFWYQDDEVVVVASERPVIQTVFALEAEQIHELQPGQALSVRGNGETGLQQIIAPKTVKACSFERIYFSRGSDRDIYRERKALGRQLRDDILRAVDGDLQHTVFSYIPNTAETAFLGMLDAFKAYLNQTKIAQIEALGHTPTHEELAQILNQYIRSEKVAIKDIKLPHLHHRRGEPQRPRGPRVRHHVWQRKAARGQPGHYRRQYRARHDAAREHHPYPDRLHPRKIVIVSSSPQVRYPDYYGIDMANMDEFIAFRAAIELLKDRGMAHLIGETYERCKAQLARPKGEMENCVKDIYAPSRTKTSRARWWKCCAPKG